MTEEFDIYVPGHSECPKCKFYLIRSIVAADLSVIGPDVSTTPNCPNDGTEMRSITWKECAIQQATVNSVLYNKILDLIQTVNELKKQGETDGR